MIRYFRKKIDANPHRYSDLERAIEASRIRTTTAEFLARSLFFSLIAMLIGVFFGIMISYFLRKTFGIEYIYLGTFLEFWKIQIALSLLIALIFFGFARYLFLSYPYYVASSRRSKIDSALPHAVNMLLGMAKGNVPMISAIRFIAENKHLFSELSVEFEKITVLVEMGRDLESAMKFVAETTPSEKLRVFLENFIDVYRGGGNVLDYLKAKSEQFFSEKERLYTLYSESMQIIAEIYLALFIVAPLFFLIVLVVFNMIGSSTLELYRIFAYTVLPLGSLIVLWLAYSSTARESRSVGEFEMEEEEIFVRTKERTPGFRFSKFRRTFNKIKNFLTYPIVEMPYVLKFKYILFYLLLPPAVFFTIFYNRMEFDYLLFTTLLAFGLPTVFFVEYRERLLRKAEKELPDFLKQLASLNEAGLNVVEALKNISDTEAGVLNKEIRTIKRRLEWGELITSAFVRLERRIRSGVFQKAVSMLIKAIEASPSIREALIVASNFSELEIEMRNRLRDMMSTYIIIIYLAFGVFLYTAYVLIKNMLAVFASIEVTQIATAINLAELENVFIETSILVAVFSGLAAGVMGEGRVEAGLKHIFLLVAITYVFFKFFV
ncbi:MAG: type II secretion system F family protein [Archaeoglobaceae archaeon]|nr:type II secretion system F family protein [Archaeoglobaceae archaeon]MDW8128176.1 type II secretion system F family protein [Archaeoglobaceae archaeon]